MFSLNVLNVHGKMDARKTNWNLCIHTIENIGGMAGVRCLVRAETSSPTQRPAYTLRIPRLLEALLPGAMRPDREAVRSVTYLNTSRKQLPFRCPSALVCPRSALYINSKKFSLPHIATAIPNQHFCMKFTIPYTTSHNNKIKTLPALHYSKDNTTQ
jgi:hypothetical protein